MTALKNADLVRLASWTNSFAKVGTLAGHYGRPVSLREIAKEEVICGSEVWTVYTGATLSSDKGFYDRERALYETAIVIAPGDIVEIDGVQFKVVVAKHNQGSYPKNSDPIGFTRVDRTELNAELKALLAEMAAA